jgi:hypothetical protein
MVKQSLTEPHSSPYGTPRLNAACCIQPEPGPGLWLDVAATQRLSSHPRLPVIACADSPSPGALACAETPVKRVLVPLRGRGWQARVTSV